MTDFATLQPAAPTAAADGLIVIAGSPGVGKSTFLSNCPSAIFFSCDGGLRALNVRKVDISSWQQLRTEIPALASQHAEGKLPYEPVAVIDTVDAAFQLLKEDVRPKGLTADGKKKRLTLQNYGDANDNWTTFVSYLASLPFLVVMLAHTQIRRAEDGIPAGHDLALSDKPARAMAGCSDLMLLAERTGPNNQRQLKCEYPGGGKDRTGGLPPTMPLEWAVFWDSWQTALGQLQGAAQ